jgi:hypothetical protein
MLTRLLVFLERQGYDVVLGEVKRPQEMQKLYFEQGKTKTLNSMHTRCLACDITLFKDGVWMKDPNDYKEMGEYWEFLGGRWGGRFGDDPNTQEIEGWDSNHVEWHENAVRATHPTFLPLYSKIPDVSFA